MKLSKYLLFIFLLAVAGPLKAQTKTEKIIPQFEKEVTALHKNPKVLSAFAFIKDFDEQTVKNQIRLTELEAPPFKEHEFGKAKLFAELLNEYGADSVWVDAVGNVIGLKKGTERKKVLALAGHIDTVFPEGTDVSVRQSNDTIYAPGISDDGRGLTTVLTVLKAMTATGIQTKDDILFIGNMGEEGLGDLRGMKELFGENGQQIDAFISIDGTGVSRIVNGGLGSHRYKITFNGPGGHSWGSFGLANPAHAMGEVISIFTKNADVFTKEGSKTSYNVGRISGGTSVNAVPFSVWMEVDMRALQPERLNAIDSILQAAVKEGVERQNSIKRFGDPVTAEVEMIGDRPSGHTDPEVALVQRAMAANQVMETKAVLSTSSTDANIPISLGIPAITLGGGGTGGGAHSLGEWFVNQEGYKGVQRTLLVVLAETGL